MRLFKKKLSADSYTSLLAEKVTIFGRVTFSGTLRIEGTVDGDLIPFDNPKELKGEYAIILGATGQINANFVRCTDAIIAGALKTKKLVVHGTLRLEKTAKRTGVSIFYSQLEIEQGAYISDCHLTNIADTVKAQPQPPVAQPADK